MRTLAAKTPMPYALYRAAQLQRLDALAMELAGLAEDGLMLRAGQALFDAARQHFPKASRWLMVCGLGNNAGDAYVVARLGHATGIQTHILQLGDPQRLKGAALSQFQAARAAGVSLELCETKAATGADIHLPDADLIFDGLFGIGLDRSVQGRWRAAIEAINRHPAPVLAIDIPSGLMADSGQVMGVAVKARRTLSFIGLKPGLFTGQGPDYCGQIECASLEVPAAIFASELPSARRLDWARLRSSLPGRRPCAHKGDCGHVLVVGGAPGLFGAVLMAAEAALRLGAGLVTVATHPAHAPLVALHRPELMGQGVANAEALLPLLQHVDVLLLGPGLGQDDWARGLFEAGLASGRPMVLDADGLNLLAQSPQYLPQAIITPHPGEAGRLLGTSSAEIQADRFAALAGLWQRFAPVVVLKGPGTLIGAKGHKSPGLCSQGNPGMASGGMGDVLAGFIVALVAQGMAPAEAAELGVVIHAEAADRASAKTSVHGLIATDLLRVLPQMLLEMEAC